MTTAPDTDPPVQLHRLRLALHKHRSDLLLVGDHFTEGGRFVTVEVAWAVSGRWTYAEWETAYQRLASQWRAKKWRR